MDQLPKVLLKKFWLNYMIWLPVICLLHALSVLLDCLNISCAYVECAKGLEHQNPTWECRVRPTW